MFSEEKLSQAGQKNQQRIGIKSFTQTHLTVLKIKPIYKYIFY